MPAAGTKGKSGRLLAMRNVDLLQIQVAALLKFVTLDMAIGWMLRSGRIYRRSRSLDVAWVVWAIRIHLDMHVDKSIYGTFVFSIQ